MTVPVLLSLLLIAGQGGRRPVRASEHSTSSWKEQATGQPARQDGERSTRVLLTNNRVVLVVQSILCMVCVC